MHTINLSNLELRTDLIIEKNLENSKKETYKINDIEVTNIINNLNNYINISFKDITDKTNFSNVSSIFIKELKKLLSKYININSKVMIIGLGNSKSTPDALGPETINNILVTRHLFDLGDVEEGYMNVCAIKPQVTGVTGIETYRMIKSIINETKVDLVIIIDALKATSINRVNKTIQITDDGISPGSGVGNNRGELSKNTLNIPVIAIGVPTIVELSTIVTDTINYLLKQLSYKVENINNLKNKLININSYDYSSQNIIFKEKDKEKILGILGNLSDNDLNTLFKEVLTPINYNLMVTPKEIDYIIKKLGLLIGNGINKSLHKNYNSTN